MGSPPPFLPASDEAGDTPLRRLEGDLRRGIRDAVNRPSRKPFSWGGLVGYRQLEAIGQALHSRPDSPEENDYLARLTRQVDRVVDKFRTPAHDLAQAQGWLRRIAKGLRYPPAPEASDDAPADDALPPEARPLTGAQVEREMDALLASFHPDLKRQPAQAALYHAWHRLWKKWGPELLPCYDIPGLPPDNLKLEALFSDLRRHQRRLSGRKSTRELREWGAYQVLFRADSEPALLEQLRHVPLEAYYRHRHRLAEAEAPRQFLRRLHRDPVDAMQQWADQYIACREAGSEATAPAAASHRQERLPQEGGLPRAGPSGPERRPREEAGRERSRSPAVVSGVDNLHEPPTNHSNEQLHTT